MAALGAILVLAGATTVYGNEVYLDSILIRVTHDWVTTPTIYFDCKDDDREAVQLHDVKTANKTYVFELEQVSLTHLDDGQCLQDCGIWDKDLFTEDDLFGHHFKICDADFAAFNKLQAIEVPGEFELSLYCPNCHAPPPLPPPPAQQWPAAAHDGSNGPIQPKHRSSFRKRLVLLVASLSILIGFLGGFVAFQIYQAWKDEGIEEARRRFQALYSDPHTDIEDLPTDLPSGRNPFTGLVRYFRKWWLSREGYRPQSSHSLRDSHFGP